MRVLVFILGIALVVWILIRLAKGSSIAKKPDKQVDDMVRCEHCGVYTPRQQALQKGERYYCSDKHRDQDR
ncbi:MAG: PP0621 family protein [Thiogranum sp.]|nr:PP0621 family protein [Thiogranum sp.]